MRVGAITLIALMGLAGGVAVAYLATSATRSIVLTQQTPPELRVFPTLMGQFVSYDTLSKSALFEIPSPYEDRVAYSYRVTLDEKTAFTGGVAGPEGLKSRDRVSVFLKPPSSTAGRMEAQSIARIQ